MSKSTTHHAVVIGAGVFGAWTAYYLQQSGKQVTLVDAYGPSNSRASSGGESRIIRMGYGGDEVYSRWAIRASALWRDFFQKSGEPLFQRAGVLWMAREGDRYAQQTLATLQKLGVNHQLLQRQQLEERYPQISFGQVTWGILEPDSGALLARRAVQAVVRKTLEHGASYIHAAVSAPTGQGHLGSLLTASGERVSADVFVFACGPWLPKVFPSLLGDRIVPTRQEVFFFGVPGGNCGFRPPAMPAWIDFGEEVYGLPDLENRGFKIAFDRHGPRFEPDTEQRLVSPQAVLQVREYLARRFPALQNAPVLETRVCQYENTSSGDFLIDRHPDFENVWLVGGGSGHGFKHGPAIGEYVASQILQTGAPEPRFSLATKETAQKRSVF